MTFTPHAHESKSKWAQWVLALVAGLAVLCLYLVWPHMSKPGSALMPSLKFDATVWLFAEDAANSPYGTSVRSRMADEIVASKLLIGMTQAEVIAELGKPHSQWGTGEISDPLLLIYFLGTALIDAHLLEVTFGEDGRVASCRTFFS